MNGKWALVTGASSGIGAALAQVLAENRINLILVARSAKRLQESADGLASRYGIQAKVMARDLADPASPDFIRDDLQKMGLTVHVLVNNAGFGRKAAVSQLDPNAIREMIEVNVNALVRLTRLFLPPMLSAREGRILNVASTAAFQPGPFMATYYATKAFVSMFSLALSEELTGSGVTVTTLYPGLTRTNFHRRAGTERSEKIYGLWMMEAGPVALAGYLGMMNGKRMVIPGFVNKMGYFFSKCLPIVFMARMAGKVTGGPEVDPSK